MMPVPQEMDVRTDHADMEGIEATFVQPCMSTYGGEPHLWLQFYVIRHARMLVEDSMQWREVLGAISWLTRHRTAIGRSLQSIFSPHDKLSAAAQTLIDLRLVRMF